MQKDSTTAKSKQLTCYQRHKDGINIKRRLQYKLTNTYLNNNQRPNLNPKKNIKKNESPSPLLESYNVVIGVNNGIKKTIIGDILTCDNILETAYKLSLSDVETGRCICQYGKIRSKTKRLHIKPIYKEILDYIRQSEFFSNTDETPNWKNYVELYNHFNNIKPRTLRGYFKELQELKWLRRHGRDYYLNPFLYQLFWIDSQYTLILEYAPFKIDLFELLNLPLINAINHKITDVQIDHYNIADDRYYREIFREVAFITLQLEDGEKAETVLPINLHAQPTKGRDLNHNCIPLAWKLFDIEKASYYSTDFKRSHHKGKDNKLNGFIHFDNSISIHYLPKNQFYMLWQRNHYLRRKTSIKYWQNGEYLEFDNYDNLKRLFVERFIKGKRRLDLFNALGMTYKANIHKPKKTTNKKPKFQPMRIDNMAMYKQQSNSFP